MSNDNQSQAYHSQVVGGGYEGEPDTGFSREERIQRLQEIAEQQKRQYHRKLRRSYELRKENSRRYDRVSVCAAVFAAAVMLGALYFYINANVSIIESNKRIASLKTQYEKLVTDNDNRAEELEGSIDKDEIYRIATQELNMEYPQKYQVITYPKKDNGSVSDNGKIQEIRENQNIQEVSE